MYSICVHCTVCSKGNAKKRGNNVKYLNLPNLIHDMIIMNRLGDETIPVKDVLRKYPRLIVSLGALVLVSEPSAASTLYSTVMMKN